MVASDGGPRKSEAEEWPLLFRIGLQRLKQMAVAQHIKTGIFFFWPNVAQEVGVESL